MKFSNKIKTTLILFVAMLLPSGIYAAKRSADFTVVIDAGHGGHDTGAVDNGVREKDINLAVAKLLATDIQKKVKNVKVIMTRNNDTFISLQERANIANRNHGNLFISIHTNSVDAKNPNRKSVTGTTVYALGLHKDDNNLKVAQRENSVIELEKNFKQKYSGFDPSKDESYIIFEMSQKKNLGQSLKFASLAQNDLVKTAGRKNRGVKQAGFWVLWATSMPSVLVELDFICNPSSAKFMGSADGQKLLAKSLCNAVEDYVDVFRNNNKQLAFADENNILNESSEESLVNKENNKKAQDVSENSDYASSHSLLSSTKKVERNDTPPAISESTKKYSTPRRRRSKASREASQNRVVETGNIPLHYEAEYLARVEKAEPTKVIEEKKVEIKETPKERKKRLALERKRKKDNAKNKNKTLASNKKKIEKKEIAAVDADKKYTEKKKEKNNKSVKTFVVTKEGKVSMESASLSETAEKSENVSGKVSKGKKRISLNSRRNAH